MIRQHSAARSLFSLFMIVCLAGSLRAQEIGFWRFDEKAPGGVADTAADAILDQSGNGHPGTAQADMAYVAGSPAHGGTSALTFTTNSDNVVVADAGGAFNFSSAQSTTFEAVVRTVNIGQAGVGCIMAKQGASPGEWWWRINANGKQQFWTDNGTGAKRNASGSAILNDGKWHHLAAVFDADAQQLRVYVDYALDGSASAVFDTADTIGNTKDLWIGAFQAGNRQFDGDMDFARVSYGALAPAEFVQPVTYISDLVPANGATFVPAGTVAGFRIGSPSIGVAATNIHVTLNGTDISDQLTLSGNDADRTVTLPSLSANRIYQMNVSVTDLASNAVTEAVAFDTFSEGLFFIEGEDYNFDGGGFIDDPQLSGTPAADNYLDRLSVEGIDSHKINAAATTLYRIGDQVGTALSVDPLRQNFVDAQAIDPGVADYVAKEFINGEWVDYTRTFPAGTYKVYARVAKSGTVPIVVNLDEVTAGTTTSSQTTSPVGVFRGAPTVSSTSFEFVPLTDALGNEVAVSLGGLKTLRLTMVSGTAGLSVNYLVFVPPGGVRVPFLSGVSPAAGADNEPATTMIGAAIRNADTQVNTGTIAMKFDGAAVSRTVSPTASGADVSFAPSLLTTGWHTVTVTFDDSAATSVTNEWRFMVANQAVRGFWKFDEMAADGTASTTAGGIVDASGNGRNGTVTGAEMSYVAGSLNYGHTSALKFTSGTDRVVVPDPAGSLNFTNSFTFEAVVRTTSTSTSAAILAKNGTGDGEGEYWWRMPGGAGGTQKIGINNQTFVGGSATLNDGNWHHVAVVYDQDAMQVRLYADYAIDGQIDGVVFSQPIGRPADLHIGSFIGGGSDFDGDIDFVRISNGALDASQFIQASVALQPIMKSVLPEDGAVNVSPKALVRMELVNRDTQVATGTLKLFIDGSDATSAAMVASDDTGATISLTPSSPLANGAHTVRVTFADTATPANQLTNEWSFTVIGAPPVLGFYRFDEKASGEFSDTTDGALIDASGSGHAATASEALPYVDGSTEYGGASALQFTVGGGHVVVPDTAGAFNFSPTTQSFTLEAVVRTINIGENSVGCIAAKQGASPGEWWWRINATGKQAFFVNDGTGAVSVNGSAVLNDGEWHHVAAIYDATKEQLRVYVDHVLDGTAGTAYSSTTSVIGNDKDVWIGAFQNLDREYDGDIDAIRITGAALDPSWFIPLGGFPTELKLVNPTKGAGSVSFSFATQAGRSYVVKSASTLGADWSDVETVAGDGTTKTVTYPTGGMQTFYRVLEQ